MTSALTDTELTALTATRLRAGYAAGEFSPAEVLRAVQDRIDRYEPGIGAFARREPAADVLAAADAAGVRWAQGRAGLLDGVPVTLKENIAAVGHPRPSGSAAFADAAPATEDGPAAASTAAEGAIRLGSTVMSELGMLSSGVSGLHGITRSPLDPAWTVGGSSGGAAAAAAAGFGPLHVGSDIGGSIRLPASWTGLASLKPSYGIVPVDPPYLGRALGPLARSVDDVALTMQVLARPDPAYRDPTWLALPDASWERVSADPMTDDEIGALRIGLHPDAGCGLPTDPEVAATVRAAAELFARAGAQIVPVDPFLTPELLHQLDMFLRARSWADLVALPAHRRDAVLPYIRQWAAAAADLRGPDVFEAYHAVQRIRAATITATHTVDVVLSPVAPVAAFPAEQHGPTDDPVTALDHIAYTAPYNFSEQPAATVDAGSTTDGRPIGLQLAGRRFADVELLRVTRWYEQMRRAAH